MTSLKDFAHNFLGALGWRFSTPAPDVELNPNKLLVYRTPDGHLGFGDANKVHKFWNIVNKYTKKHGVNKGVKITVLTNGQMGFPLDVVMNSKSNDEFYNEYLKGGNVAVEIPRSSNRHSSKFIVYVGRLVFKWVIFRHPNCGVTYPAYVELYYSDYRSVSLDEMFGHKLVYNHKDLVELRDDEMRNSVGDIVILIREAFAVMSRDVTDVFELPIDTSNIPK